MKTGLAFTILASGLLLMFLAGGIPERLDAADDPVPASGKAASSSTIEPIELGMHELMEYLCEEPYKRLRDQLASEPADKAAWRGVKSDSLILAEAGNLLLDRGPKEHEDAWRKNVLAMREVGRELYTASKAREYKPAREKWEVLITKCNACHTEFADGEHQLTP